MENYKLKIQNQQDRYKRNAQTVGVVGGGVVGALSGYAVSKGHTVAYTIAGFGLFGGLAYLAGQNIYQNWAEKKMLDFENKERHRLHAQIKENIKKLIAQNGVAINLSLNLLDSNLYALTLEQVYQLDELIRTALEGKEKKISEKLIDSAILIEMAKKADYIFNILKV